MNRVCVDAGLAVKMVIEEPDTPKALALFGAWIDQEVEMIAPAFFEVETDSIVRKKALVRREMTLAEAYGAFVELQALPIKHSVLPEQRQRAWEIADDCRLGNVYDATYLALADLSGCEFWTADERLYNSVKDKLPFVRLLSEFESDCD
jgi:predicted nucleic acid-binding protein